MLSAPLRDKELFFVFSSFRAFVIEHPVNSVKKQKSLYYVNSSSLCSLRARVSETNGREEKYFTQMRGNEEAEKRRSGELNKLCELCVSNEQSEWA